MLQHLPRLAALAVAAAEAAAQGGVPGCALPHRMCPCQGPGRAPTPSPPRAAACCEDEAGTGHACRAVDSRRAVAPAAAAAAEHKASRQARRPPRLLRLSVGLKQLHGHCPGLGPRWAHHRPCTHAREAVAAEAAALAPRQRPRHRWHFRPCPPPHSQQQAEAEARMAVTVAVEGSTVPASCGPPQCCCCSFHADSLMAGCSAGGG